MGHDLTAAAGMAQLQGILRSLAWDRTGPTGAVVDRLDDAMHAITTVPMATLVLAVGRLGHRPLGASLDQCRAPASPAAGPGGNAQYLEAGQGLILGTTWASAVIVRVQLAPCRRGQRSCCTPTA
ncbi:SpoIIE family protein phosphatase [Streptomyces sp. CA-142005]|uniref:SpoIIE family protein phosphatase n=1 Tax=Streptomyces sp. CA-142005 TaxID=3240052 RepID=UPI003D8D9E2C